jgi:hypothetical protein
MVMVVESLILESEKHLTMDRRDKLHVDRQDEQLKAQNCARLLIIKKKLTTDCQFIDIDIDFIYLDLIMSRFPLFSFFTEEIFYY